MREARFGQIPPDAPFVRVSGARPRACQRGGFAEYLSLGQVPDATSDGAPPEAIPGGERWVSADSEFAQFSKPQRLSVGETSSRRFANSWASKEITPLPGGFEGERTRAQDNPNRGDRSAGASGRLNGIDLHKFRREVRRPRALIEVGAEPSLRRL